MNTPFFPVWRRQFAAWGRRSSSTASKRSPVELQHHCARFLPPECLAPGRWRKGSRDRIFDLSLVFWCFIWQVLQPRTSCRAVVRHVQAFCETGGRRIDENSSAYCQARQRIPVACIQHALEESAHAADSLVPQGVPGWSRPIKVVDGTSVQLADTGKNRARYPYASGQKPGCGFPAMKVLALYSLASGAILKTIQAIWSASDYTLFRQIWAHLLPGDVIMGDRAFCSYEAFASLPLQGVDIVCRMHQTRIFNRHEAMKIGPHDWLTTWKRLKVCKLKRSMPSQDIAKLPASIAVRIIHVKAIAKGFRTKELWIATTLLNPVAYPAEQIAYLYLRRWSLELCFRDLKTTMGMEVLRCQTPDMVHKELLAFLIAHNFIRCLIAQAAHSHSTPVNRISFKGTVDASRSFFQAMRLSRSVRHANLLYRRFLEILALDRVPHRPDRREPRAVKRRPKNFQRLTKPRHLFKEFPHRSRYKAPHHA